MGDIVSKDKKLTEQTNYAIYDFDSYMSVYPQIREKYGNLLLQNMKGFLAKSQKNNPVLDISGLEEFQRKDVGKEYTR